MKKRNVAGLIVIALFVIGIAVALMQYKREQTYSDEQKNVLASEKVVSVSYTHLTLPTNSLV